MKNNLPFVSAIIPCKNEEKFIGECLQSILNQDYPKDKIEVLVVDGRSQDRSREIVKGFAKRYKFIKLLDNVQEITPVALNIGIRESRGEYIFRLDAHSICQKNYIKKCLEWLEETKTDCVGGVLETLPSKDGLTAKAISLVLSSPFGAGGSTFRTKRKAGFVDTVPFGAWRRDIFKKVGLFNKKLARNQDIELNSRIIKAGGKIFLSPEIKISYFAPSTLKKLICQQFRNGLWNIYTQKIAPNSLKGRHFIPFFFVSGLLMSLFLAPFVFWARVFFALIAASYLLMNLFFSLRISFQKGLKYLPILLLAFFTLHFSYGLGSIWGLFFCPFGFKKCSTNKKQLFNKIWLLLPAVFFIILTLSFFNFLSFIPEYLRVFFAILSLIFYSGFILIKFLFSGSSEKIDVLEFLVYAFCFGVVFWTITGLAFFYLRLNLNLVIFISLIILFLSPAFFYKFLSKKNDVDKGFVIEMPKHSPGFIFFSFLVIVFGIAVFFSAFYHWGAFDTFYHLAGVQKLLSQETYKEMDFFLNEPSGGFVSYLANSWYFILAVITRISQVGVEKIYVLISAIASMISVLVIYVLSKLILKKISLALIASSFFTIYFTFVFVKLDGDSIFKMIYLIFIGYPGELLRFIIFPILIVFFINYILSNKRVYLFSFLLLLLPIITIHVQFYLYFIIALFSLFAFSVFRKKKEHILRIIKGGVFAGIIGIVFYFLKQGSGLGFPQKWLSLPYVTNPNVVKNDYIVFSDNFYILNFKYLFSFQNNGFFFLLVYVSLMILFAALLIKKPFNISYPNLFFLSSIIIVPLFLLYNPLIVPLLVRTITWVLPRRMNYFSGFSLFYAIFFSFFTLVFMASLKKFKLGRKAVLLSFVFIILLFWGIKDFRQPFITAVSAKPNYLNIVETPKKIFFRYIAEEIPPGSYFCSDVDTSYLIGAYSSHYVLVIAPARMTVTNEEITERFSDISKILNLELSSGELIEILKKRKCDYVVFKKDKLPLNINEFDSVLSKNFEDEEYIIFKNIVL